MVKYFLVCRCFLHRWKWRQWHFGFGAIFDWIDWMEKGTQKPQARRPSKYFYSSRFIGKM